MQGHVEYWRGGGGSARGAWAGPSMELDYSSPCSAGRVSEMVCMHLKSSHMGIGFRAYTAQITQYVTHCLHNTTAGLIWLVPLKSGEAQVKLLRSSLMLCLHAKAGSLLLLGRNRNLH